MHLAYASDEPMASETGRSEVARYDEPTEYSYPEELTPYAKITVFHNREYQTLDRRALDWEIAKSKVSIIKIIGQGAFGMVAKATVKNVRGIHGERVVAVKMMKGLVFFFTR